MVIPTVGRSSLGAAVELAHACATSSVSVEVLAGADLAQGLVDEEWVRRVASFPLDTRLL